MEVKGGLRSAAEKKGKERKGKERKGKERKGKIKLPDLQKDWKGLHSYQGRQKTL